MQHGAMPDVSVFLDNGILLRYSVYDATVLNIRAFTENDSTEVAAQRRQRADVGAGPHDHITDQNCRWMDKRSAVDDRGNSVDGVNLQHGALPVYLFAGYSMTPLRYAKHGPRISARLYRCKPRALGMYTLG